MNPKVHAEDRALWPWTRAVKVALIVFTLGLGAVSITPLLSKPEARILRVPMEQLTFATVQRAAFRDLIPIHAKVVPRETIYIDATDGGRIDRLMAQSGDVVEAGQPLIELSNTNLALLVIQQESQLNQAISQLQQNEIALEQNKLANERALTDIDYQLVRLERLAARRQSLAAQGLGPIEQRDMIADELAYYTRLRPIQVQSGQRQAELRERLLPDIHQQLNLLRQNLEIVHHKLDSLVIRAPLAGRVTALDLKVGENRSPGQRLAEITPELGMTLSANVDEVHLGHVYVGQPGVMSVRGQQVHVSVRRVSPQVRGGTFQIDLDFDGDSPLGLVSGAAIQGRLQGENGVPTIVLSAGTFLESLRDPSVFVVASDNKSAKRRQIKIGRRSAEQLEILKGLSAGERVIASEYTRFRDTELLLIVSNPMPLR